MALVLTRKERQTIKIGDHITVVVVKTAKGKCRVGIDAPKGVTILRGEVAEREAKA